MSKCLASEICLGKERDEMQMILLSLLLAPFGQSAEYSKLGDVRAYQATYKIDISKCVIQNGKCFVKVGPSVGYYTTARLLNGWEPNKNSSECGEINLYPSLWEFKSKSDCGEEFLKKWDGRTVSVVYYAHEMNGTKPGPKRLDLNGDKKLNESDIEIVKEVLLGVRECPKGKTCDINGDGKVSTADYTNMLFLIYSH